MTDRTRRSCRLLLTLLAALVVAGLASEARCLRREAGKAMGSHKRLSQPTVDPEPPASLSVELVNLQKNPNGGVASLLLRVNASVSIEGAVVSAKVPGNLVFSDGSTTKTWTVDHATVSTQSIAADVIVPQDGKYVISTQVSGTAKGSSIHRGTAYKLLVGVQEPAPKVKDGAIEYPGSPGGGV